MKKIPNKLIKIFVLLLKVYLAIFLVGLIERIFIFPWISHLIILIFLGFIASFVFAVWLGIYAGKDCKRRWFYPVVGVLIYFCLFFLALQAFTSFFANIFYLILSSDVIMDIVIIISAAIIVAVLTFIIRVVSKWKTAVVIRAVLITIAVVSLSVPVGVFLNKRYCPTYYKYPDFIIREMGFESIQKLYGTFDQMNNPSAYERWGAYNTYTDEQGNDWYYTIYYGEFGRVRDIRMEIH